MIHAEKKPLLSGRLATVFLLLVCGGANLFAAVPAPWAVRAWRSDEGLPDENVTGVAQSSDGYLWVTTHNGLARFDGFRFLPVSLPISPGHSAPLVRSLMLAGDDSLWLALEVEGGLVIQLGSNRTNVIRVADGLPRFRPLTFVQTAAGEVWVAYADGSACRIAGGKITRFTAADGLPGTGACWLASDAKGQLWFAKAGRVGIFREGAFETLFTFPERTVRMVAARDGSVWVCAGKRVLKCAEGGEPRQLGEILTDRAGVEPAVLFEDHAGGLWIGTTAGGLFHFDGGKIIAAETSHSDITAITEDREGNLWVGTSGGGLDRLRNRVLELHSTAEGMPFDTARSVCEDSAGGLWAVGANGALARTLNGVWQAVTDGAGWSGQRATCVSSDGAGGVWIGTYRGGLYHFSGGNFTALQRAEGMVSDAVRSLLLARNGDLWIATERPNAILRLRGTEFKDFNQPAATRAVRAIAEDAAGVIWLGTTDGNLLRVEGDNLVDETARVLQPTKPIRALHGTPDGSLWLGYAGAGLGLLRDGKFSRFGTEQGLHDDYISEIMSDNNGSLWMASGHGIFRVRQRALYEVAAKQAGRVVAIVFGRNESLPNVQGSYGYGPSAARGRDGNVWFATRSGIIAVNVDRVLPNSIPPVVLIERVLVDGKPLVWKRGMTGLRLPPEHRSIEVEFTALSYAAPESVLFKHQLQNWDADWINDGAMVAQRKIAYTRLPAGDYEFRVTACNNAGVWNMRGANLSFVVEPFFWQTWWFRLTSLVTFTLIVVGGVRYVSFRRLRTRLQKLAREAALTKERLRIARDIHDDVGASFAQIALLGELARADIAEPGKTVEHVGKMTDVAREGINALDEIVWAVNPNNDTLAHFLDYAGQYAVDYLQPAGVRCRVDMPHVVAPRNLPANVRHGLFLIVKESLHNVVKHAQAKEVWLRANITDSGVTMSIEDDGQGFAATPDNARADGLRNMRERMKDMGGVCDITSVPGKGTTVKLVLPWKERFQ